MLAAGSSFLVGAGLIRGMQMFIGLAADFERSMNQFQAVTHATSAEMKAAGETAIALGRDITLPQTSAQDAALAMAELAKGGLSVVDSMDAAKGSLQLAAAAGTDFATAAVIQARALQAFGLAGTQAVHVADALANAANQSTAEITDMAFALRQASAVAHETGLTLDDTVAALAELANKGLTASDAGTSLRTFLLRLIPASKESAKALRQLGIEPFDAAGNFQRLDVILEQFRTGLGKLTEAQRQQALITIFGQDAIRAATILTEGGAAAFNKTKDAIGRHGAAAQLAAARNRGLAGTFDALKSNVSSIAIELGQKALPALTNFVKGVNTTITNVSKSKEAADFARGGVEAFKDSLSVIADVARTLGPPLLSIAKDLNGIAQAVGSRFVLGAIASYFALTRALRLAASTAGRFGRAMTLANGQMRLTRVEGQGLTRVVSTLGQVQAQLASGQAVSAASIAKTTNAATEAQLASKAWANVLVHTLNPNLSEAHLAASNLAIKETAATEAMINNAITLERDALAAEADAAAYRLLGIQMKNAQGQYISLAATEAIAQARRQEAIIAEEALAAAIAERTAVQRAGALGSAALAGIGGIPGLIITGLTLATTAFLIFHREGKSALDELNDATKELSELMLDAANSTDQLAAAQERLPAAIADVAKAQKDLALARGDLVQARRSEDPGRIRSALLARRDAEEQVNKALAERAKAERDLVLAQDRNRGIQDRLIDARVAENQKIGDSFDDFGEKAQRSIQIQNALGKNITGERAEIIKTTRQTQLWANSLDERARKLRADNPLLARHIEQIAELARLEGHMPSAEERAAILADQRLRGPLTVGKFTIVLDVDKVKLAESVDDARHNILTQLAQLPIDMRAVGKAAGDSLLRQMADTIREGEQQIRDAIDSAKSNLISIGSNLGNLFDQAIDAGPLGEKIRFLQAQLDASQRSQRAVDIKHGVRDAREQLAAARASIAHIPDDLSPKERKAFQQRVQLFLRPYQENLQKALAAAKDFNTEGIIAKLQTTQQKQKDSVKKGLQDIIAEFAAGKIPAGKAIKAIAGFIGQHTADFKEAGRVLGVAFTLQFQTTTKNLFDQILALDTPRVRARKRGFPGEEVIRPEETIAAVRREVLAKQQELIDSNKNLKIGMDDATAAINRWLDSGVVPTPGRPKGKRPTGPGATGTRPDNKAGRRG